MEAEAQNCSRKALSVSIEHSCSLADLGVGARDAPPPPCGAPKFFRFHAVFGKIWQNSMLVSPPPRGVVAPSWGKSWIRLSCCRQNTDWWFCKLRLDIHLQKLNLSQVLIHVLHSTDLFPLACLLIQFTLAGKAPERNGK